MDALGDAITVILTTIYSLMWEGVSRYPKDVPKCVRRNGNAHDAHDAKEMPNICPIYAQNM